MRVVNDRDLRVVIEHPLQQSCAGPGTADDKQIGVSNRTVFAPAFAPDHDFSEPYALLVYARFTCASNRTCPANLFRLSRATDRAEEKPPTSRPLPEGDFAGAIPRQDQVVETPDLPQSKVARHLIGRGTLSFGIVFARRATFVGHGRA